MLHTLPVHRDVHRNEVYGSSSQHPGVLRSEGVVQKTGRLQSASKATEEPDDALVALRNNMEALSKERASRT